MESNLTGGFSTGEAARFVRSSVGPTGRGPQNPQNQTTSPETAFQAEGSDPFTTELLSFVQPAPA